ncbi:hypothetical protein VSR68_11310 [Paraburkholderia phymatum]|uniref:hypothetical protein n=1 Tax=Paraburkholderia phymatum TaxID=148447 RepID=UPI00316B92DF
MKDLQEAIEKICELKGECNALQIALGALLRSLPPTMLDQFESEYAALAEMARVTLINSDRVGDSVISAFDLHVQSMSSRIRGAR